MFCSRMPQFTPEKLVTMGRECTDTLRRTESDNPPTYLERQVASNILELLPDAEGGICIGCKANNADTKPLLGLHLCYRHARSVLWPNK